MKLLTVAKSYFACVGQIDAIWWGVRAVRLSAFASCARRKLTLGPLHSDHSIHSACSVFGIRQGAALHDGAMQPNLDGVVDEMDGGTVFGDSRVTGEAFVS
jgi:hypothetical protein